MVDPLEGEIREWRAFVERSPAVAARDVDELEVHLRDQIADLDAAGLAADEAFLVAVKRLGRLDDLTHEFAREHRGRLWKQLMLAGADEDGRRVSGWADAVGFAVAAAVAVQLARVAAGAGTAPAWLVRNASLLVLPFLAGYLARRRRLSARGYLAVAAPIVVAALTVNLLPFSPGGATELLAAAHLPLVLWFPVASAYTRGALRSHERRLDVVRFTGEWCIYYALIALGGGVLMGLTAAILGPAGVDAERIFEVVVPSGAAGAVVVAAWLVESKQRVVENMAPVLTVVFTPLFAVMVVVATVVYAATGLDAAFDRELLGVLDALLVVILGLVLYGLSARDPWHPPGWTDAISLVAVVGALLLDLMVLGAMLARIGQLGFTPNRTVALGLNLLLLVDLAGAAWHSGRFLAGRGTFHRLERWHTAYLPAFVVWAAAVVVVLPPLFAFR